MVRLYNKKGKKSPLFYAVWASPGIGVAAVTALLGYITFFATDVLGLSSGLVGALLLVSKIFDGVSDIVAGFIIDRTHTKLGKARPYDVANVLFCISALLFFFIPDVGTAGKAAFLFVIYMLTYSIFQTLYSCAGTVYLARAVDDGEDQISLSSVCGLLSSLIAIVLSVLFPTLIQNAGTSQTKWQSIALAICLPSMVLCAIRIFLIPEINDAETEKKNQEKLSVKESAKMLFSNDYLMFFTLALLLTNIAQTLMANTQTYYFKYVIGDIQKMTIVAAVAIIGPLTIASFPVLSKKMGLRNLMALGLILGAIGRFLPLIGTTNIPILTVGSLLGAVSYMPIYILCANAIIDCMDYGEYKSGHRGEGIYTCVSGFCSKVGIGIASGLLGLVTALGGYDGTQAVQSASANMSIIFAYTILPGVLYIIGVLALRKFNLEEKLPEIRSELKRRKGITE